MSSLHGEENVILLFVEVADSRGIQEWRFGIRTAQANRCATRVHVEYVRLFRFAECVAFEIEHYKVFMARTFGCAG